MNGPVVARERVDKRFASNLLARRVQA